MNTIRRWMSPKQIDEAVDRIIREPLPGEEIENPKYLDHARVIREMAARGAPDHTIAGVLNVRSLERIRRARSLLGCPSGSSPSAADGYRQHRVDAESDLMRTEDGGDDPEEAA